METAFGSSTAEARLDIANKISQMNDSPDSPLVQPVTTREQRREYHLSAQRPTSRERQARQMVLGLGCLSLGIGMVQLLSPGGLRALAGLPQTSYNTALLSRAMGLREVVCGVGLLASKRPENWLWARAAGDVIDLGLLSHAAGRVSTKGLAQIAVMPSLRLALASAALAGLAVLDVHAALLQQEIIPATPRLRLEHNIVVNRPPAEVYQFWRDFANFPRFMRHIESIIVTSPRRSHWVARGPFGRRIEWDAEITIDQPAQLLAWRSSRQGDMQNFGTVRFIPQQNGMSTLLQVEFHYSPPATRLIMWLARQLGSDVAQEVGEDLQRFKQLLETGQTQTLPLHEKPTRGISNLLRRIRPSTASKGSSVSSAAAG